MEKPRFAFIDVARGITILLVVAHHNPSLRVALGERLFAGLGMARMPLFFFLSGLFLQPGQPGQLRKRVVALLKPYGSATLLFWLVYGASSGSPAQLVAGALWANGATIIDLPLWFLPHLCLASVMAIGLARWLRLRPVAGMARNWMVIVALFAGGVLMIGRVKGVELPVAGWMDWLPWGLDISLLSSALLLAGFSLRQPVLEGRLWKIAGLTGGLVLAAVMVWSDARLDMDQRILRQPLLVLAGSAGGISAGLGLARWIAGWPRVGAALSWVGKRSLLLLVFHYPMWDLAMALVGKQMAAQQPAAFGWLTYWLTLGLCLALDVAWQATKNGRVGERMLMMVKRLDGSRQQNA